MSTEIRNWLEVGYFVSQIIVMFLIGCGLWQLRLTKQQIEIQKKATRVSFLRDSLKLTAEQITRYSTEIIPLQNNFHKKISSNNIYFFKNTKVKITGKEIKVDLPESYREDISELITITEDFLKVVNAMEGFSVYFVSGVADEKVAFYSLSSTFCKTVKELLPLLVIMKAENNCFESMIGLFLIWNSRLESNSLEKQKRDLEEKIKNTKTRTIKIVGDE